MFNRTLFTTVLILTFLISPLSSAYASSTQITPEAIEVHQEHQSVDASWMLSIFVPGLYQLTQGKFNDGFLFLGGTALAVSGAFFFNSNPVFGGGVESMILGMGFSILSFLGLYIWNIINAF